MIGKKLASSLLALSLGLFSVVGPKATFAAGVVGDGTPASCTEAALTTALTGGGNITFNCGAAPITITLTASKTIGSTTSIDGGGLISLSGNYNGTYLSINSAGTLNLSNITLRDNSPGAPYSVGSTVYNAGTLNVSNATFLNNSRKAIFNQSGTLTVDGSTFDGNTASGTGSAIGNESEGTVTVRDSVFRNNKQHTSQSAGAIYNGSNGTNPTSVTILRSVFTNNQAGSGGAISNHGTMVIKDSLFSGNLANSGGAIEGFTAASLTIENTTISGNIAGPVPGESNGFFRGGGISVTGSTPGNAATLNNVTLANNTAPATNANNGGGNIALLNNASLTLQNTIIANPAGGSDSCVSFGSGSAVFTNGGNNLQFPGTTCGAAITTADPQLSALGDNGGYTATHAIAAGSPARNAGNNNTCPSYDQRSVVRPQGGACDIGAFEYGAVPVVANIDRACAPARGASLALRIVGTNFIGGPKGTRILVDGTELPTTLIGLTQLTATVPASILNSAGSTITVTVRTPTVDGGEQSTTVPICLASFLPLVIK